MPLITFEEALIRVQANTIPIVETESVPVEESRTRVLAQPILAGRPNPAFDNSAVDGYLLGSLKAVLGETFEVAGEIRAGSKPPFPTPAPNQALRIFTGAPVPEGEFCVVMQEDVVRREDRIELTEAVAAGSAIRRAGTDFAVGTELVAAGTRIGAAEIALAAWNGRETITAVRTPRVTIGVTGDELLSPGANPEEGQIFDSNGPMLQALAESAGPAQVSRFSLPDDLSQTKSYLSDLANPSDRSCPDLILISGGASVGDYDHVPAAVAELGEIFFHGVSVKPGKPVLFGRIGGSLVFGLPGNPASAYVCFEIFVRDALRRLSGEDNPTGLWAPARYAADHPNVGRDEFIRVRFESKGGELLAHPVFEQGSFGLRSLSAAQGLARLPANRKHSAGESVACLVLPR